MKTRPDYPARLRVKTKEAWLLAFKPVPVAKLNKAVVDMKQLIEDIAKALVDLPDQVVVSEVQGEQVTVLELRVAPTDLGKVIGKQGRTARSIRTLLGAAGMKLNRRFTLEMLE